MFRTARVETSAEGVTSTHTSDYVSEFDSQSRLLRVTTELESGLTVGEFDNLVAETTTVWNSQSKHAKVLSYPMPVAGRESCWTTPMEEQRAFPGEPIVGLVQVKCKPAGEVQTSECPTYREAVNPPLSDIPKPDFTRVTYDYCLSSLKHIILPGKLSEKDEDLGTETTRGLEAQGCRTINIAAGGTYITDKWLAKTACESLVAPKRSASSR